MILFGLIFVVIVFVMGQGLSTVEGCDVTSATFIGQSTFT